MCNSDPAAAGERRISDENSIELLYYRAPPIPIHREGTRTSFISKTSTVE
ncbi:MAG: hypothetical protein J7L86_05560 [Candidatus Marinimicrobia bacterium]|nr:hypothetical protein [Candidatus Neomarinimicrobiota bacterium]